MKGNLVDSLGWSHSALDVERADVLPVLLEERHQEVDSHLDVNDDLILGQVDVSDGDTKAKNLLKLELNSALDLGDLFFEGFGVGNKGGEFTGLVKSGSQETRDLTKNSFGGEESVVLAGQLLDELLVLVQLLEGFDVLAVDSDLGGLINVDLVSENAELHSGLAFAGELDGSGETLILLGIVVLETDLEFNGLDELSVLLLGESDDALDGGTKSFGLELAAKGSR